MIALELWRIDWGAIGAISSILIAALGFLINNQLKKNGDHERAFTALTTYRANVMDFSFKFFEILAETISISEEIGEESFSMSRVIAVSNRISTLLEVGRFLFPNDNMPPNDFGIEKGPAFSGARRPALDCIMAAYRGARSIQDGVVNTELFSLAKDTLWQANQPESTEYNPESIVSFFVECRRAYINSVFPSTLPSEWQSSLENILIPVVNGSTKKK